MASGFPGMTPDRSVLAGRIQGFGNVNPPPLEEDTGGTLAKKAVGRLGEMVGEEVMLTVEDFREKGPVGAVKDAVADAGDILIDGVSGLVGWIRGDPLGGYDDGGCPAVEVANSALSNGPAGAAYGVSQASPTGGINAVWVMPEDADPAALAELNQQAGGLMAQAADPRVPKNIMPYEPSQSAGAVFADKAPLAIPGGPVIAPYEPAPSGPRPAIAPYVPGGFSSNAGAAPMPQSRWGPSGYAPSASSSGPPANSSSSSGAKALVKRVSKGEALVGPDVARRLVSMCSATNTTAKQLAEMVCERVRRLYLGLDDDSDADAAINRLLGLIDSLRLSDTDFTRDVVKAVVAGVSEELLSLRSNAKLKDESEPLLQSLGLLGKESPKQAPQDMPDLLSGSTQAAASSQADLLSPVEEPASQAPPEADLLSGTVQPLVQADLLSGGDGPAVSSIAVPESTASLDLLLSAGTSDAAVPVSGADMLAGLEIDTSDAVPPVAPVEQPKSNTDDSTVAGATPQQPQGAADIASHAALDSLAAEGSKKQTNKDAFGFVGGELTKAQARC